LAWNPILPNNLLVVFSEDKFDLKCKDEAMGAIPFFGLILRTQAATQCGGHVYRFSIAQ